MKRSPKVYQFLWLGINNGFQGPTRHLDSKHVASVLRMVLISKNRAGQLRKSRVEGVGEEMLPGTHSASGLRIPGLFIRPSAKHANQHSLWRWVLVVCGASGEEQRARVCRLLIYETTKD